MDGGEAILVVEDEAALRIGLCDILAHHGYRPTAVDTGSEGLAEALGGAYALVLLDIMLPELSGFEVCRRLRTERPRQAIFLLTALGREEDILEGFRCGADDYVTKPFSVAQLVARIDALLRRVAATPPVPGGPFPIGDWIVDPAARVANCNDDERDLTTREVALLAILHAECGRIVSRRRLLIDVWGMAPNADLHTRTVDMHIAKLRKKLLSHATGIETVRGEGYRYMG